MFCEFWQAKPVVYSFRGLLDKQKKTYVPDMPNMVGVVVSTELPVRADD